MPSHKFKQMSVLTMNTVAFTACFAIWIMFAVIGVPIKETLGLSETQFGVLVATPILTGSLLRLPLGLMTDRFGGRPVYFGLLVFILVPLWFISAATAFWHYLLLGLVVGCAGASFSVGIAYTARWFPKEKQGFAMGIFGAGNAGAAITKLVAPSIVLAYGWQAVPKVYTVALAVVVVLFWFFTYSEEEHKVESHITLKEQFEVFKDPRVWKYCQYYSLVFGGFVGVSLWMTHYYVDVYHHDLRTAALLASIFVLPSGVIRALGGWLSDKFGAHMVTWWVMWITAICLFIMSYPHATVIIPTAGGEISVSTGINEWVFTGLLFVVGICWGFGKASVFKYLSDDFPENIGAVSGIVGLAGGMGGFLLPIMFGMLMDYTGLHVSAFMLLFGVTLVALFWMNLSGERELDKAMRARGRQGLADKI